MQHLRLTGRFLGSPDKIAETYPIQPKGALEQGADSKNTDIDTLVRDRSAPV